MRMFLRLEARTHCVANQCRPLSRQWCVAAVRTTPWTTRSVISTTTNDNDDDDLSDDPLFCNETFVEAEQH
jgi:hypothetical protein